MVYICNTSNNSTKIMLMNTFTDRARKDMRKASDYFLKMHSELDLEKYKLPKYQELFQLSSFQAMHDADLAYHNVYRRCADCASSKQSLLACLDEEEKLMIRHPRAFNGETYRLHALKAIAEIREHLKSGNLDYLHFSY